ncbi:30S ribosomal protein S6 [Candidatus Parcubacteria bacterium]|nr:30S ribosomal protein S6 [Candidatus Parcubacteria bacterium]
MTENKESTKEGFKVYELGIHLLPTLSEADVQIEFSKIKSNIEKLEGEIISESAPRMFKLAYEIPKTIKAQKKWYETAFFGWVKFELEASKLATFEKFVKELEETLRYLIVKTVRENTLVAKELLPNYDDEVNSKEVDTAVATEEVVADVVEETGSETEEK